MKVKIRKEIIHGKYRPRTCRLGDINAYLPRSPITNESLKIFCIDKKGSIHTWYGDKRLVLKVYVKRKVDLSDTSENNYNQALGYIIGKYGLDIYWPKTKKYTNLINRYGKVKPEGYIEQAAIWRALYKIDKDFGYYGIDTYNKSQSFDKYYYKNSIISFEKVKEYTDENKEISFKAVESMRNDFIDYNYIEQIAISAVQFQKFYNKNQVYAAIQDDTNYKKVKVMYDYVTKEYISGPYKLVYNSASINETEIGKIKNMCVNQYIPRKIVKGELKYDIIKEEVKFIKIKNLSIDYPTSGEEFYIRFKGANNVTKFNLDINYESLNGIAGIKGYYYELESSEVLKSNHDIVKYKQEQNKKDPSTWYGEKRVQDLIAFDEDPELIYVTNQIETETVNVTMKLGGNVWIDKEDQTLNHTLNGIMDETGKFPKEEIIPQCVIVTLYKKDRTEDIVIKDGVEETVVTEEDKVAVLYDENGNKVANPRTLDENGYYEFSGLSSGDGDKYYVEFQYDGVNYQDTFYNMEEIEQQPEIEQPKLIEAIYGTEEWMKNSKGMEDMNERIEFNQMFSVIDSYRENYNSKNYEWLNREFYENTNVAKSGKARVYTKSNYDIKEIKELALGYMRERQETKNMTMKNVYQCYMDAVKIVKGEVEENDEKSRLSDELTNINNEYYIPQFIVDSYMKVRTKYEYPCLEKYTLGNEDFVLKTKKTSSTGGSTSSATVSETTETVYKALGEGQLHINQGLYERPEADIALVNDVYSIELSVNNKSHTYMYDQRAELLNGENGSKYWYASNRWNDENAAIYNNAKYIHNIYEADYRFGTDTDLIGKGSKEKLEIIVTYKTAISNRSNDITIKVDEVVSYYDDEFKFITAYYTDENNNPIENEANNIVVRKDSIYKNCKYDDEAKLYNLDTQYFDGPDRYLSPKETVYLYTKYEVRKKNDKVILDTGSNLKEIEELEYKANIVEIKGYSTRYRTTSMIPHGNKMVNARVDVEGQDIKGAGIIDRNSTPGNVMVNFKRNIFVENDTDKAPKLYLVIAPKEREINGFVWEDVRDKTVEGALIGNGKYEKGKDGEVKINDIKVELIELKGDTPRTWKEIKTGKGNGEIKEVLTDTKYTITNNGKYIFRGFVAGDYIVRFTYGNEDGKYTGFDYKSTTYQDGVNNGYTPLTQNTGRRQNETGGYVYNIEESEKIKNVSDAKDIWTRRDDVSGYYRKKSGYITKYGITNKLAKTMDAISKSNTNGVTNGDKEKVRNNTYMYADTGVIDVKIEKTKENISNYKDPKIEYNLLGIDFGLEEIPKAQLELTQNVTNVKIILSSNQILMDSGKTAPSLLWNSSIGGNVVMEYNKIKKSNARTSGIIQATIDDEILHGALLIIQYNLKVQNVGEITYKDDYFYYKGTGITEKNKNDKIVKTSADVVYNFVSNNIIFENKKNSEETLGKSEIVDINKLYMTNSEVYKEESDIYPEKSYWLDYKMKNNVEKYNTILKLDGFKKDLVPKQFNEDDSSIERTLILTQVVSPTNKKNDLYFSNIAEIVKTTDGIGRRMAFSIEGNSLVDEEKLKEPDTAAAEPFSILPPFGEEKIYYTLIIVVGMVLIVGIITIKKVVLKKK